jgi:hypothetical protein
MKVRSLYLMVMIAALVGCGPDREVVQVYKGDPGQNGTSCSVGPALDEETFSVIGAKISCTDGSSSLVLNGAQGPQGVQGPQGQQGIQGPVGQTGAAGASCQAYRSILFSGVWLACPNQFPVLIKDGEDGEDGEDCKVKQLSNGARITCGSSVAYVYNGQNGQNGTSCSISNATGGAQITCGSTSQMIYDGQNGAVGPVGPPGPQGQPGQNALANAIGIKGYIYPCGQEFANDEIFLRLTDGKILALYDGGPHEDRLALLAPGNYITTDRNKNQACQLTVDSNLNVTSNPPTTGLGLNN